MINKLQKKIDDAIEYKSYSQPYNDTDLEEMYWYGVFNTVKQLKEDAIAYPIGGIATPALTDKDLDAILRRLEGESNEEKRSNIKNI